MDMVMIGRSAYFSDISRVADSSVITSCLQAVSYTHLSRIPPFRRLQPVLSFLLLACCLLYTSIAAAQSGYVDLSDGEAFTGDEVVKTIINAAHEAGVKVIASNHDFFKTPETEEIIRRLCMMQELGADIPKLAVMPTCKQDVITLLSATLEMSEKYAQSSAIRVFSKGSTRFF